MKKIHTPSWDRCKISSIWLLWGYFRTWPDSITNQAVKNHVELEHSS